MRLAYPRRRRPSGPTDSFSGDSCPCRHASVMEYKLEDELTLYDPQSEVVHILNATAAVVWQMCNGFQSVHEISLRLSNLYGMVQEAVEEDVRAVLAQLLHAGLIQQSGSAQTGN